MKKRILFIMPNLQGGGAEKVFIDILNRFDYERFEVSILLMRREGVYESLLPVEVEVLSLKGNYLFPPRIIVNRFNYFGWLRFRLRRLLGSRKFDVIVSFLEGSPVFAHYCVSKNRNCRNISWVHSDIATDDWTIYFFKKRRREIKCYSIIDQVVAVSSTAATGFKKIIDGDIPVKIIPNFVDRRAISLKATQDISTELKFEKYLIFVGRLEHVKRPDRFVDTIFELRQRGIDANGVIIGTGSLESVTKARLVATHLSDKVEMLGFRSNPYPFLKRAYALILCSDAEGDPLVVKEAMTLGVPVISTAIPSVRTTIEGKAGLISGFSANELADKAEELLKHPELRSKLSSEALKIATTFDVEKTMSQIYDLLLGQNP